ncbi:MAG: hypothetical protein K5907_01845 [Treponema sp.]|nr:hypothetical protein [Treponema sp.]
MKKIVLLILMFFFTVCCIAEEKKMQSLKKDEIFLLEYEKGYLEIYKGSENKKEFYFEISTYWGAYQLSKDRQQLMVYSDDKEMFYLLDGKTGTFKSITKKPSNSMTTFDLKYMIWEKENSDYKTRSKMPTIVITDLQNDHDLYEISWEELKQDYMDDYSFGYHFIRSNEPDYDFFVYAKGEGRENYLGFMKINIKTKNVEKYYGKNIKKTNYPPECYGE